MATLIKENVFLVVVSSFKRTKKKKKGNYKTGVPQA